MSGVVLVLAPPVYRMSTDSEPARLADLVTDIKTRLDDLEDQLEVELDSGRDRIDRLTADLRERVDALRGQEPEPEPTRAEQLRSNLDELRNAIEAEIDEGTEKLSVILADVDRQVRKLEQRIRER